MQHPQRARVSNMSHTWEAYCVYTIWHLEIVRVEPVEAKGGIDEVAVGSAENILEGHSCTVLDLPKKAVKKLFLLELAGSQLEGNGGPVMGFKMRSVR